MSMLPLYQSIRSGPPGPLSPAAALGSVENLRSAFAQWVPTYERAGGDRALTLPLGWSKALSREFSIASGTATIDLIGGSVLVEVRGLTDPGISDVWLVDNRPHPGDSVAPE